VLDIAAATTRPLVVATMVFRNFGSAVSTGPVLSTAMTLTEAPTLKPRRRAARAVSDSEVVPLINRCVTVRIIWRVLFALSGGGLDLGSSLEHHWVPLTCGDARRGGGPRQLIRIETAI